MLCSHYVQIDESGPRLLFTMLPLSGVDGNSETSDSEKDLDEAIQILQNAVNSYTLTIFVEVGFEEGNPEVSNFFMTSYLQFQEIMRLICFFFFLGLVL